MLLDQGGARVRAEREARARDDLFPQPRTSRSISMPGSRVDDASRLPPQPDAPRTGQATVTFHVTETHDGEGCDCIEQDMTLRVGQEVELTHVCHDGRVDKVIARVTAITPATEHGTAMAR